MGAIDRAIDTMMEGAFTISTSAALIAAFNKEVDSKLQVDEKQSVIAWDPRQDSALLFDTKRKQVYLIYLDGEGGILTWETGDPGEYERLAKKHYLSQILL